MTYAVRLQHCRGIEIPVFVGGSIPVEDRPGLMELGVVGVYTNDMKLDDIVSELARALS